MKKRVAFAAALLVGAGGAASADALIDAVRAGNGEEAVRLIENGADANAADSLGTTPLMWAARYGDAAVVKRLIRAGAKPAAENVFGVTPMSEAALIGSEPVIRELLAAGVDPDSPNPEGETALMLAVRTGQLEAAKALIDAGADVNARERWAGQTALMWAGAQLQPQMVKLLLAHGAEVNARSTVREWTRKVSSEPRPKELAQGGLTPLMFAARTGCIDCAELLLAAGADINLTDPSGVTPLIVATLNLQNDFAKYLVEKGADINEWDLYGRTALYVAIDMMDYPPPRVSGGPAEPMTGLRLAEFLLDRGANPNAQLKQWRPPFVRLARGQDNTLATGATPLLRAAHSSDVAAVKLLLAHKALVDLPNASGITPLMAAAGVGVSQNTSRAKKKTEAASIEVARLLLEAGADVNRVTHDPRRIRQDPLVREAMYGFIFQMAFDYAYLPPSGRTALHGAAQKGWNDMVRLLVEHGAKVQPVDATGRTPRNMAMGNYELAITEARPDPLTETVALLEQLCREDGDCDPKAGCDLDCSTFAVPPVESQLNQTVRLN
ncbi:MAG TPA: ankyrin repeat domain-containing protein [Gammaproteobacteria bacterium]|nr:ankyrin repeat domain-containing protein [Gammaproteobacteria bacterium]